MSKSGLSAHQAARCARIVALKKRLRSIEGGHVQPSIAQKAWTASAGLPASERYRSDAVLGQMITQLLRHGVMEFTIDPE